MVLSSSLTSAKQTIWIQSKQALAQLDRLLNIETAIKRTYFALLVRIKNILTPEQEARLEGRGQGRASGLNILDPGGAPALFSLTIDPH
jgi:hypothetical protein